MGISDEDKEKDEQNIKYIKDFYKNAKKKFIFFLVILVVASLFSIYVIFEESASNWFLWIKDIFSVTVFYSFLKFIDKCTGFFNQLSDTSENIKKLRKDDE